MSDDVYSNVIKTKCKGMGRERVEMIVDIYESTDEVRGQDFRTETNTQHQQPQNTGSNPVKTRSSRAVPVCLVLLYFLLLTAVIVLCVFIYTNNTNYTEERNQLLIRITNITEERDELLKKHLLIIRKKDGWIYYGFSYYYMSNESKNWAESRQDCLRRRADLVVINNKDEHDFVMNITHKKEFWIGVTDSEEEGTWKWVDGSLVTSGFWASNEPNGNRQENCAITYKTEHPNLNGWIDFTCNGAFQWICEKSILPLTVP